MQTGSHGRCSLPRELQFFDAAVSLVQRRFELVDDRTALLGLGHHAFGPGGSFGERLLELVNDGAARLRLPRPSAQPTPSRSSIVVCNWRIDLESMGINQLAAPLDPGGPLNCFAQGGRRSVAVSAWIAGPGDASSRAAWLVLTVLLSSSGIAVGSFWITARAPATWNIRYRPVSSSSLTKSAMSGDSGLSYSPNAT